VAACSLAGGTISTTGTCSTPAAAGFEALDGFGTTAPLLIGTSDLIQAATVKTAPTASATVLLYDLTNPAAPVLVDPTSYVTEPCEVTQSGLSPVVAIQPAGATSCDATSPFRTRPLKDDTHYGVVISDGVLDKTGHALGPGTVARILLFTHPLVDGGGVSQLVGIDDATAGALEVMRQRLVPVLAKAGADAGITPAHVAMAYTFKTQSIAGTALALTAAPYSIEIGGGAAVFAVTGPPVPHPSPPPAPNVSGFFDVTFNSVDAIDKTTGALRPTLAADLANPAVLPTLLSSLKGLVAVPQAANVPFCAGGAGPRCARVVVIGHGLGGDRSTLLALADSLAAQGLIAVATDFPLHGDRAWCASSAQCGAGGVCTPFTGGAGQGDAVPPGTCTAGAPIPQISGQYFISQNFFRTRDVFRQNLLDQSALVLAMARPPAPFPQPAVDARAALLPAGVVIDPSAVRYLGISLGSLAGASVVASNPRLTGAVLNVGGGTAVDVFTTSPAFVSSIDALLAGLGIAPGSAAFLQFVAVAKTILDPADPVNFAVHLSANRLPDLLTPAAEQPPKAILTQAALCDQVVPNVWNYLLAANAGTGPLPGAPGFGAGTGSFQLFLKGAPPAAINDAITACGVPGATSAFEVTHGFLADFADPAITGQAQADAATFLQAGTLPPSLVDLP
jgi:hypothetical protein